MTARTVLRWISAFFLLVGFLGLVWRFLGEDVAAAVPLTLIFLGFIGVLALFLKD